MNNPNNQNTVLIVKDGHEGGFTIDGRDGKVLLDGPNDCLPDWAPTGATNADLHERRNWYINRIGAESMKETLGDGHILNVEDLKWYAFDGDTMEHVEVEADFSWRAEHLAKLLGLTPEGQTHDENIALFDKGLAREPGAIEVEVANSYDAQPTDAELLDPAKHGFEEEQKTAQQG